jgi:bifunctional non-homologous end joining protein LigD
MPQGLKPMAAVLSTLPRDDENWAYEIKWDGIRAIAYCETGRLRLESRTLRDITPTYPELRALAEELGSTDAVLDGEVVAFDDDGKPSFERLQGRMNLASDSAVRRRVADCPVTYMIFDLLYLDGHNLMDLPYTERRERLEGLGLQGPNWQTPSYHRGDGNGLLKLTKERGLEGLVAKRLDSRYLPGKRTRAWLKVKNLMGQELVIGGWLPGKGRRANTIGALLVGYYEGEDGECHLRYAGRVGTGFTDAELDRLAGLLGPLRTDESPFTGRQPPREAVFVEPKLVAEIEFREWTAARTLRAPVYKGLRPDTDPSEVVFEGVQPPP